MLVLLVLGAFSFQNCLNHTVNGIWLQQPEQTKTSEALLYPGAGLQVSPGKQGWGDKMLEIRAQYGFDCFYTSFVHR